MSHVIVTVYPKNLLHNFRIVRSLLTPATKICVAAKANAYGHGLDVLVAALKGQKISYWGVARLSEAERLQELHVKEPALFFSVLDTSDIEDSLHLNTEYIVGGREYLKQIAMCAKAQSTVVNIHLKIDTGMGRMGILPRETQSFIRDVSMYDTVRLVGICSHFSDSSNEPTLLHQCKVFNNAIQHIDTQNILCHIANSGGVMWDPAIHLDMVRPGIVLYGVHPVPQNPLPNNQVLAPCMKVSAVVSTVRTLPAGHSISYLSTHTLSKSTTIATINMGYGDGLLRSMSNKGHVSIHGTLYPIVGKITMDMCMVDVGKGLVKRGDEAIFWGVDNLTVEEQAANAGTIPYELFCMLSNRTTRTIVT